MNNEQLTKIKQHSDSIVKLCENPNTALQAIHQIVTLGGAGELRGVWSIIVRWRIRTSPQDCIY